MGVMLSLFILFFLLSSFSSVGEPQNVSNAVTGNRSKIFLSDFLRRKRLAATFSGGGGGGNR